MKPINLSMFTEEIQQQLIEQMTEKLTKSNVCDTKLNFSIDITDIYETQVPYTKAYVEFTPHAWVKLMVLTQHSVDEVAAHGVVTRVHNVFTITDILVYPQIVKATYVESDDDLYGQWMANVPDNVFNKLRFQFHSHVQMSVTPSPTDKAFYEKLLQNVKDFYIFMIINKRGDMYTCIYDVANNIIFEDSDIITQIMLGKDSTYEDWAYGCMDEMVTKAYVKKEKGKEDALQEHTYYGEYGTWDTRVIGRRVSQK